MAKKHELFWEKRGKDVNLKLMEKLESQIKPPDLSRLFNISIQAFEDLQRHGLTLDQLFYLECLNSGLNSDFFDRVRGAALRSSLERKGYISNLGIVKPEGTRLLESMHQGQPLTLIRKAIPIAPLAPASFDKWWNTYPGTDVFTYRGKSFTGSRSMRVKKEDCRAKFNKVIAEGEFTPDDLLKALEYEVTLKKEASLKEGANKLSYLQNSLTYLNQRSFENFVELARVQKPIVNNQSNITDI